MLNLLRNLCHSVRMAFVIENIDHIDLCDGNFCLTMERMTQSILDGVMISI